MPELQHVALAAAAALVLGVGVGWALAGRIAAGRALALAPALGWAVFSALALPILTLTGFTRGAVAGVCALAVITGLAILRWRPRLAGAGPAPPLWAYGAAAILALGPALAVWPKLDDGGLVLAEPMFDHSKIAIIDAIVRQGLPPIDPFIGGAAGSAGLAYYYLWHFDAAVLAKLVGASGWEADIALTWFTGFASLALMMGLAAGLGGYKKAAFWVVAMSFAGSLRPLIPAAFAGAYLYPAQGLQAWLFQTSWAPQHVAAASCVVLSACIMARLGERRSWALVPLLAVVVAAGFESSSWVGGIVFAAAALPAGVALLALSPRRLLLTAQAAVASALALALASPFLAGEWAAAAARQIGLPIALSPFPVLGPAVGAGIRRVLDVPACWILLVIEFPAIAGAGAGALIGAIRSRKTERALVASLACLAGASLAVAWLCRSTIANNDLGWRGVLPGVFVLTIFAAAGLARWLETGRRAAAAAALAALVLGIPGGVQIVAQNLAGMRTPSAALLAESSRMWAAVRRYAAPGERVGNNPLFLADAVRWPINISWALFADRPSCYAGWDFARAFVPLPPGEVDAADRLFVRVFAGQGTAADVVDLAQKFACRVIALAASDGAFARDPFAVSPFYRLVDERAGKWRIYRAVEGAGGKS